MNKKHFALLIVCLFGVAIIVSACGGDGKTLPTDNSSLYYLFAQQKEPVPVLTPTPTPTSTPTPTVSPDSEPESETTPDLVPTPVKIFAEAQKGDEVEFGRYPQTKVEGSDPVEWQIQPIKWLVLSRDEENKQLLAISLTGLDVHRFDDNSNVWGSSEIRGWLNGDGFYNKIFEDGSAVFTDDEKSFIKPVVLSDVYMTESLYMTEEDNVFLLSNGEANAYFAEDSARMCKPTDYAVANGAWVETSGSYAGYSVWWLRSPNPDYANNVYDVINNGRINYYFFYDNGIVVRPALWIKL